MLLYKIITIIKQEEVNNGFELKYVASVVSPARQETPSNKLIKNVIKACYNSFFQSLSMALLQSINHFLRLPPTLRLHTMARRKATTRLISLQ